MRLLEKSDIQKQKNQERAREIEEGLKVSRKVDSLRETMANEEHTLEVFRKANLAEIGREIQELQVQKDDLKIEVAYLKEEIRKESILTREERLDLEDLKQRLDKKQVYLDEKQKELDISEINLACAIMESSEIEKKNQEEQITIANLKKKVQEDTFQASKTLENAKKIENRIYESSKKTTQELDLREKDLSEREKQVLSQKNENERVSQEQAEERIRIADQWSQIQKTAERLRANRL